MGKITGRPMGRPIGIPMSAEQRALRTTHGHTWNRNGRSGELRTYKSWTMMKQRCLNPRNTSYPYYGGRGIVIDVRWLSFENFLADMGERPEGTTLDRIDNNGHYEPFNCRWATLSEQAFNRRPR